MSNGLTILSKLQNLSRNYVAVVIGKFQSLKDTYYNGEHQIV